MNDMSPLVLAVGQFYVILGLLALIAVLVARNLIRAARLRSGVAELKRIFDLAAEALREHSAEKCEAVNELIDGWDKAYEREFGTHLEKLTPIGPGTA